MVPLFFYFTSVLSIYYTEFELCDGEEHCRKCFEYRCLSPAERKAYFNEHRVCWTEFARLTYFNLVRCSIIDPMHNLLLGEPLLLPWYTS